MADEVSRREVVAFRLGAHHLTTRLDPGALSAAAGACGIQDSPPTSALLALHARVRGVEPQGVADALGQDRSLLRTWSVRGAPFCLPTSDAAVFTTGVLPPTEEARRRLLLGVGPAVDELGMSLDDAVGLVRAEIGDVLAGRRLAIGELGAEVAERVAHVLPATRRARWEAEGPYAAGQPLGEAVVHFCVRVLTLEGVVCFAPRAGNTAPFVLLEEWLGHPVPPVEPEQARAELLRRYLRCYGPSTRRDFAAWLGVAARDAGPWWDPVADELTPVTYGGRSWILTDDVDSLGSAPMPTGVRLLGPRDPYTQMRDRDTIVDRERRSQVWRTVGEPGTVLADGEIAGTWRPRKNGRRLTLHVSTFRPLPDRHAKELCEEAERVAPLRGAASVTVELETA